MIYSSTSNELDALRAFGKNTPIAGALTVSAYKRLVLEKRLASAGTHRTGGCCIEQSCESQGRGDILCMLRTYKHTEVRALTGDIRRTPSAGSLAQSAYSTSKMGMDSMAASQGSRESVYETET